MSDFKVTIIQSPLYWENKEKNLDLFTNKINAINDTTDLIVLPEMFTTGFTMNAQKFSETLNAPTINWMAEMSHKMKCAITGSFIGEENGNYFNRLIWMLPDGNFQLYDKRHLFRMGEENDHYSTGTKKLIVTYKGWKICPLICYDLRFPVWSRNGQGDNNYDLLIYVANWPESRAHAWKSLLVARAIENQSYVVGVNRIGVDGKNNSYSGDSAVYNAKGEQLSNFKPHQENTETILLDKNMLEKFRKDFPVLLDTDTFEIKK